MVVRDGATGGGGGGEVSSFGGRETVVTPCADDLRYMQKSRQLTSSSVSERIAVWSSLGNGSPVEREEQRFVGRHLTRSHNRRC